MSENIDRIKKLDIREDVITVSDVLSYIDRLEEEYKDCERFFYLEYKSLYLMEEAYSVSFHTISDNEDVLIDGILITLEESAAYEPIGNAKAMFLKLKIELGDLPLFFSVNFVPDISAKNEFLIPRAVFAGIHRDDNLAMLAVSLVDSEYFK